MNRFVIIGAALSVMAFGAGAGARGNIAVDQAQAATCAACHGADGNSVNPQFPKLAGQNAHYIIRQLQDFKSGRRKNPIMSGMAAGLSDQAMQEVATWFASQTVKPGEASPGLVKTGEAIYRGGDQTKKFLPASPVMARMAQATHQPDILLWRDSTRPT